MTTLHSGVVLTPEERLARRRLIVHDALSLLTLFLITAVIFALTWLLHRSFEDHREELGRRWKTRGEQALAAGHPQSAIEALRSALAYVPDRGTEIELATALADAGKTTEAMAYFSTLWDSAPGDGTINVQLARLAARQGNEATAVLHYQEALDGTWQGNGYDRRREVRLELANYLLSRGKSDQARTQLLIAAGNAPDDPAIKIQIAGMMEKAGDLDGALGIYRTLSTRHGAPVAALSGAGRTSFELGMYRAAADYLSRTLAQADAETLPEAERDADRGMFATADRIQLLFPAYDLPARLRAERILSLRNTAHARLAACSAAPATAAALGDLVDRWNQLPARLTVSGLEQDPDLEQTIFQLVCDTETVTASACGQPSGDDALILRIAKNPGAVEQP
ncbi:MAG TPA: tetratricopeptide repeat protein [Acidobacteriaceae bacterium]|nr:tetratricopeptide repeat protein [Acidobacteriaceae bacterium]